MIVLLFKLGFLSFLLLVAATLFFPFESGQVLDELLNVLSGSAAYTANVSTRNGVLTPVDNEINDHPIELTLIQGAPPSDLNGVFLRVGPNELTGNNHGRMTYHLFDGQGMVHAVTLKDGRAFYARSWLRTPRFQLERDQGRDVFHRIGTLFFPWLPFRLLAQYFKYRSHNIPPLQHGTANTNIMLWGTRLYALNEASLPFEFGLVASSNNKNGGAGAYTIQSIGYNDFDTKLDEPVTAHPRRDPESNTIVFASYNTKSYQFPVGEISQDNTLLSLRKVSGRNHFADNSKPAIGWAHDAALTPNYVIIPDGGSIFTFDNLKRGVFVDLVSTLGFTVVPRHNDTFDAKPFVVTSTHKESIVHIATAWETQDAIVVAAPISADLLAIPVNQDSLQYTHFRFAKMTLPKQQSGGGEVAVETIDNASQCSPEFPRVHPDWDATGRPVPFAFASCITPPEDVARVGPVSFNAWAKFDLEEMRMVNYIPIPHPWVIGELAPVPKQGASSNDSDAVWLMGTMVNVETLQSRVVLYDGQSPSEQPVALWESSERIPAGFHSQWYYQWQLLGQEPPVSVAVATEAQEEERQAEDEEESEEVEVEEEVDEKVDPGGNDEGNEDTTTSQAEIHEEL